MQKEFRQKLLRQRYQNKRYLLKGFTTVEEVEAKYSRVIRRNTAGHIVTLVLVVILLILLWSWIHPLSLLREIGKTIGF